MVDNDLFWTIVGLVLTITPGIIYWYAIFQIRKNKPL